MLNKRYARIVLTGGVNQPSKPGESGARRVFYTKFYYYPSGI